VPDRLVPGAKVLVLAQNPGDNEEKGEEIVSYQGGNPITHEVEPQPLIGATGYILAKTYLPMAGLQRDQVSYANVIKCRVGGKNKLPEGDEYDKAVAHCTTAHLVVPDSVEHVVAMGAHAIAHVAEPDAHYKVATWRGYVLPSLWQGRSVYAVGHLADTFRSQEEKHNARADWQRLGRWLREAWPKREPRRGLDWWVFPHDTAPGGFLPGPPAGSVVYLDTEYKPNDEYPWLSKLTLLGLRWGGLTAQYDLTTMTVEDVADLAGLLEVIASRCTVVLQNAAADLPILEHTLEVPREAWVNLEDTMLMHTALWSESDHGMAYLSSLYGWLDKPKSYRAEAWDFYRYNAGDLVETEAIYLALLSEYKQYPQVLHFYHTYMIPAIHILTRAAERGFPVHRPTYEALRLVYETYKEIASEIVGHYIGYPINAGSNDQMIRAMLECTDLTPRKGKHTKSLSMDKEVIAELREKIDPAPDVDAEAENGLSPEQALERIDAGAHPLLEGRVVYAEATSALDDFINPLDPVRMRVHPRCKQYAQASLRLSWVDPPMQNVPADLECMFGPDPGSVWFGWDWSGQEDWFHAAEAGDTLTLKALERGEDLHTLKARQLFGIPSDVPVDKKGAQRDFGKRYRHRLKFAYPWVPENLKNMPGVKKLGLDMKNIIQIMARDAAANPRYIAWRERRAATLMSKRYDLFQDIPTYTGRFRRSFERDARLIRVGLNASQGCGADQLYATLVALSKAFPRAEVQLAYSAHDSGVLHVRCDVFTPETCSRIMNIVQAPVEAYGMRLTIPATFWFQSALGDPRRPYEQATHPTV